MRRSTVTACATTQATTNTFRIPQGEFFRTVKTIALAPVNVPRDLQEPEPVKAKFEALIAAQLQAAGFALVPAQESTAIWQRLMEQMGGLFDPLTGQRDEAKYRAVRGQLGAELRSQFGAEAVLIPRILVVRAPWSGIYAMWDGTKEAIRPAGATILMAALGVHSSGQVGALSLGIAIEDIEGAPIYTGRGGIQLLAKQSEGTSFTPVPRPELFANEERNVAAVTLALEPLLKRPGSDGK